jgi:hypothetical protein
LPGDSLSEALVDHQGFVVMSFSWLDGDGATRAGLFRTLDGRTWERIGDEQLVARAAANARREIEASGTYLFTVDRPSESGTGRRRFTHVVRPASGVVRDLPRAESDHVLSEDGHCIAAFANGGNLEVLDTTTGRTYVDSTIGVQNGANTTIAFVPMPRR